VKEGAVYVRKASVRISSGVVQCQRYQHGLSYLISSLRLWRGGGVALNEMQLLMACVFVKGLFGFLGGVLGGGNAVVDVHDYHKVTCTAICR
jgi:hypothetical protein